MTGRPSSDPGGTRSRGAVVELRGWGWRHSSRSASAVSDVDLRIEAGERVLLLGPSGSGKSTLLLALAGILGGEEEGEEHGDIRIDGRHPADARGTAGLVLQDPDTQAVLARVGDDVAFACENLGVPREEIWRRVAESLDAVDLDVPLDRSTQALSGGQKQRLALAGVLAMSPSLILLDEPTANLDPAGVADVRDAVRRVVDRTGATLVVVEHRVSVWADLVDRTVVLGRGGGVLADGATDAVLADADSTLHPAGVWLPGRRPAFPPAPVAGGSGELLLAAADLAVGRRPFGARDATVVASGVSARIVRGGVTAVTGPNGAGKSTSALTIAGLLPPVAGTLEAAPALRGDRGPSPIAWRPKELLRRIGTVFQEPEHQFLTGSVRAELAIGPRALGLDRTAVDDITESMLDRLGLGALADANPFTLSGGEKRRLSVATVLATSPAVLVLDEPTFGQDARTWESLVALIAERRDEGCAVVLVTHDEHVLEALHAERLELASTGPVAVR